MRAKIRVPLIFSRYSENTLTFGKTALALIGVQLAAYFAVLLHNGIIAGLISVAFLGQIAVIFGYASLLTAVFSLGWPKLILRDVAKNRDCETLHEVLLSQGLVVTLASLGATAIVGYGATRLLGLAVPDFAGLACFMSATTICVSLFAAVMEGRGHVLLSRCISGILRPLIIILAVTFMSVTGITAHMTGYFVAQGIYTAIFVVIALWFGVRVLVRIDPDPSLRLRANLSAENIQVLTISGFNILILVTDILMLQLFEPLDVVGNYSIIVSMMTLVAIGMGAVNALFLPSYGHAIVTGDWPAAREMFATSRRISSIWSTIAVGMVAVAATFAAPVFGITPDFRAATAIVIFLGVGQFINAVTGPNTNSLFVEGRTLFIAISLGTAALMNVLGNFLLVPWLGALGAALSTGIFVSLVHLVQFAYSRRTSSIHNAS